MKYINNKYYGLFNEINSVENPTDLQVFNCVDTGKQYRFFEGKWYKQPVYWVDRDDVDSGSGLPDVTAADNGDVLAVVDGAWDKAEPSGGGATVVRFTYDGETGLYTCNKTFAELVDLITRGEPLYATVIDTSELDATEIPLTKYTAVRTESGNVSDVDFESLNYMAPGSSHILTHQRITVTENAISEEYTDFALTPVNP